MTSWKKSPAAVLITLIVLHVMAQIDRNMLLGFSPQITKDLMLTNGQYGFLVGAVWVLSFGVMAVFLGSLADRFSRPRVIAAGILIWSICTAASGHAHDFEQMALARFFVATGEAALVPTAVALLVELFSEQRRGTAIGTFFIGIPVGIGLSFLLAGSLGASLGWRSTYTVLGIVGAVIALPLAFLREDRGQGREKNATPQRGEPFVAQMSAMLRVVGHNRALLLALVGFVLFHMVFAGFAFTQLWMVRERGFNAASIAKTIGALQIVVGVLGCVMGGVLSDRLARRFAGGHASFMVLLIALCAPFMIAYRFVPAGSPLFYVGMCAGFFLPLALYGPGNTLLQALVPANMRATITGFTMLLLNVFALAGGSVAAGMASDYLVKRGSTHALTIVLLATDILTLSSGLLFWLVARQVRQGRVALDLSSGSAVLAH